MTRWLTVVLALPLIAAAQETAAPPRSHLPKPKDRYGWMAQLRADVSLAMDHAGPGTKLQKTLQKDTDTLRQALEAHQNKKKVDERKVNASLVSLYNTFSNQKNEFSADERAHVMEDLEHVPAKEIKEKPMRPARPMTAPRPRRYPPY
jgi:hypothetical protein